MKNLWNNAPGFILLLGAVGILVALIAWSGNKSLPPPQPTAKTRYRVTVICDTGINATQEIYYSLRKNGGHAFHLILFNYEVVKDFGSGGCSMPWTEEPHLWTSVQSTDPTAFRSGQDQINTFLSYQVANP